MSSTSKTVFIWVSLLMVFLIAYVAITRATMNPFKEFNFSRFMQEVDSGAVREVTIGISETHSNGNRRGLVDAGIRTFRNLAT